MVSKALGALVLSSSVLPGVGEQEAGAGCSSRGGGGGAENRVTKVKLGAAGVGEGSVLPLRTCDFFPEEALSHRQTYL